MLFIGGEKIYAAGEIETTCFASMDSGFRISRLEQILCLSLYYVHHMSPLLRLIKTNLTGSSRAKKYRESTSFDPNSLYMFSAETTPPFVFIHKDFCVP